MGGAVRVGSSVRRSAGPWSPTIQRLLAHLREHDIAWVPTPMGCDPDGRDSVSFLPGVVPQYPLPGWIWTEDVLVDATKALPELHQATVGFDTAGASWRMPAHEPVEVICHNDFAPYNMVFTDHRLTGIIDWDTASPGPRVWDVAYLAYRLVPLTDPANADGLPSHVADRLRLLCDSYGHGLLPTDVLPIVVERLHDLAAFTQARVEEGHVNLRSHVDLYRGDAHWITTQLLTS